MSTKNMDRLVRFALAYPGWHTYADDQATKRAIRAAVGHGFIETHPNVKRQFRAALPEHVWFALAEHSRLHDEKRKQGNE